MDKTDFVCVCVPSVAVCFYSAELAAEGSSWISSAFFPTPVHPETSSPSPNTHTHTPLLSMTHKPTTLSCWCFSPRFISPGVSCLTSSSRSRVRLLSDISKLRRLLLNSAPSNLLGLAASSSSLLLSSSESASFSFAPLGDVNE